MNVVYVTGNQHKAKHFSSIVGMDIERVNVDVNEIQSLNLREVVEYKAKATYEVVKRPVIVEDTKLVFRALGALPGPFIKWFMEELGHEGLCRLVDGKDRTAFAGAAIAYYDGENLEIFERELEGEILQSPVLGGTGFGWNAIFKPKGADKSLSEMDKQEFESWYCRVKPFDEIASFLRSLDK